MEKDIDFLQPFRLKLFRKSGQSRDMAEHRRSAAEELVILTVMAVILLAVSIRSFRTRLQ